MPNGTATIRKPPSGWQAFILAMVVVALLAGLLAALFAFPIAPERSPIVNVALGLIGGGFNIVLAYYFGSSTSSRAKDDVIGQIASAPSPAAPSPVTVQAEPPSQVTVQAPATAPSPPAANVEASGANEAPGASLGYRPPTLSRT